LPLNAANILEVTSGPGAQMDEKTRKANKKLADLRRKEEDFLQKMCEAELR
jgi:hypothetical protein